MMQFSLRNYSWKLDEHDVVRTRQLEIKQVFVNQLGGMLLNPVMI